MNGTTSGPGTSRWTIAWNAKVSFGQVENPKFTAG
jgi:hypothetical protein